MSTKDSEPDNTTSVVTVTREKHITSESVSGRTLLKVKKVRRRRGENASAEASSAPEPDALQLEEPVDASAADMESRTEIADAATGESPPLDEPGNGSDSASIITVKKKKRRRSHRKESGDKVDQSEPKARLRLSRASILKYVSGAVAALFVLTIAAFAAVHYAVRVSPVPMASVPVESLAPDATTLVSSESALNDALANAKAGDHIAIAPGTYRDWQITVPSNVSGTAAQPIIIMSDLTEGVIFEGDTRIRIEGDYVVLHGMTFRGDQTSGDSDGFVTIGIFGAHNRVSGNRFFGLGDPDHAWKATVQASASARYAQIDNNSFFETASIPISVEIIDPSWRYWRTSQSPYIHHNTISGEAFPDAIGNQFRIGIQLGQDEKTIAERDVNARIEKNVFTDFHGLASIESKNSGAIIRYNRVYDSDSVLMIRAGRRNVVEGNVLIRTAGGIAIAGEEHRVVNNYIREPMDRAGLQLYHGGISEVTGSTYEATSNSVIAHNTVLHLNRNAVPSVRFYNWLDNITKTARGNRIVANILVHRDEHGAFIDSSHQNLYPLMTHVRNNRIEANLLWRLDGSDVVDFNADMRAVDSYRVRQLIADPLLDLRNEDQALLRENSPAIEQGAIQITSYDLLLNTRNGRPDMGAFEWQCEETFRDDCESQ